MVQLGLRAALLAIVGMLWGISGEARLEQVKLTVIQGLLIPTSLAVNTVSSAGFVSSDASVSFALNIPQNDTNNDLYFTLSGSTDSSWIAIGMGSNKMANCLYFMVYADSTGSNITLSPRISHKNVEPTYTQDMQVDVSFGSGIANGVMTANGICRNCRSWNGGSIDPTNTKAPFIFAHGPNEDLKSSSLSANLKRHARYGDFTMDLTKAVGSKAIPNAVFADTAGTVQNSDKTDHDLAPPLHAVLMIGAFVFLMPAGIIILRILKSPKWHAINQGVSVAVALLGGVIGIYIGTMYNRSKAFTSAHQILGIFICIATVGQLVVGYFHHRIYVQEQRTTVLRPIHLFMGRVLIGCGIANGFLGFPLALNPKYFWAMLVVTLLLIIIMFPLLFWRYRRDSNQRKTASAVGMDTGYQAQPWTMPNDQSDIDLGHMNYPASPREREFL